MTDEKAMAAYTAWLNAGPLDPALRQELRNMIGKPDQIEAAFGGEMAFGTAGLRAPMGPGSARMNLYTVAAAAAGYAGALLAQGADKGRKRVVIAYDSRHHSEAFARAAAAVIAERGVQVLLSDALRPLPMLAYGIRYYRADGGLMITASHNPPQYNGIKFYGPTGAQLSDEACAALREHIPPAMDGMTLLSEAKPLEQQIAEGGICMIGEELDDAYDALLRRGAQNDRTSRSARERLRIVYSPLHGAGEKAMRRILAECGYERVYRVGEQDIPDGDFPTLRAPNPEREDSYELALRYAYAGLADLVLLTDPDADRLGVAAYDGGGYRILNGNQISLLLLEYILSGRKAEGTLPEHGFCVTTLVSTRLARVLCERYGVTLYETLPGTKSLAAAIQAHEAAGESFLFAFEGCNGYMPSTEIYEQDAIASGLMMAEVAALSRSKGLRLPAQLDALYDLYGHAAERQIDLPDEGGVAERYMAHLRSLDGKLGTAGTELGWLEIKAWRDYLPEADMLVYELGDLDWVALRPSGTEPKFKVYAGFYGAASAAESRLERLIAALQADIECFRDQEA